MLHGEQAEIWAGVWVACIYSSKLLRLNYWQPDQYQSEQVIYGQTICRKPMLRYIQDFAEIEWELFQELLLLPWGKTQIYFSYWCSLYVQCC